MHSEYEKKQEKIKEAEKKSKNKNSKGPEEVERLKKNKKEIESLMSEAELLDLCTLDTNRLAKEITATEVKIIMDITPVEILKFSYNSEADASPTLVGYINFTNGLTAYVASTILDCAEQENEQLDASSFRKFHAQSEKTAAQKHWTDVMKCLLEMNNRNSVDAVFKGIMKTNPSRIMKEEISEIFRKASDAVSHETEKELQASNILYIRDVKTVEKHLIDASCNKNDKESPGKFRRIVQYLNYIRLHSEIEADMAINHALISIFRKTKDVRTADIRAHSMFYSGCFLFLENSGFISLE